MIGAAVASNAAFLALGRVFGYPEILREPPAEILARFNADQPAIIAWFLVLAAAAACLIPVAVLVPGATSLSKTAGVLAGLVQVLGLIRWAYAVPVLADAPATPEVLTQFQVLHQYLGVGIGETLGYLGTAAWTLLVITGGFGVNKAHKAVGIVAALGILAGVAEPAGLAVAGTINFAGYVLWSVWLIWSGVTLIRGVAR